MDPASFIIDALSGQLDIACTDDASGLAAVEVSQ